MNQAKGKKGILAEDHFKAIWESNNLYLNLFQKEFENFKSFKNNLRVNLIKQNKNLRNALSKKIKFPKNSTKFNFEINEINENKDCNAKTKKLSIDIANKKSNHEEEMQSFFEEKEINKGASIFVNLEENNFSIKIPKGIFFYPLERVIRADDIHVVNFIPYFSHFRKFEKVIEKTNTYLDDWFDEIPHNLEADEKIFNPEFAIWILIKGLQELQSQVQKFDQLFFVEILTIFSNIIEKSSSTVFKIFQNFLKRIINNKKPKGSSTYRTNNSFCVENFFCSDGSKKKDNDYLCVENHSKRNKQTNCIGKSVTYSDNFINKDDNKNNNECNLEENLNRLIKEKNNVDANDNLRDLVLKYIFARENCVSPKIKLNKPYHNNDFVNRDSILSLSNNADVKMDLDKYINENSNNANDNETNENNLDNKTKTKYKNKNVSNIYDKRNDPNYDNNEEYSNKKKVKKEAKNTPKRRMDFFRGAYCQVCFTYYCPYHFKRDYKFYDYEFNNITLHRRYLKRLITEIKQRPGLETIDLKIFPDKAILEEKEESEQKADCRELNLSFNMNLNEDEYNINANINEFDNNVNTYINNNNINNNTKYNDLNDQEPNENKNRSRTTKTTNYTRNTQNLNANKATASKHLSAALSINHQNKKTTNNDHISTNNNTKNNNNNPTSERERRPLKTFNNYCDSESPRKQSSSLHSLARAKQVIQAYKLNNINDYNPCQAHEGACTQENCVCLKLRSACEKFCFCSGRCKSEYPGCFCVNGCNASCSCATNLRECDPDVCKCCGFNSVNKSNFCNDKDFLLKKKKNEEDDFNFNLNLFEIGCFHNDKSGCESGNCSNGARKKKENSLFFDCGNCSIFFGKRKKTCLSQSLVAENYGLFALEDIDKDEFICEYIGELLSREETDRRSVFNDQLGLNYFFKLNEAHDIDAYAIGNEMRYSFVFFLFILFVF